VNEVSGKDIKRIRQELQITQVNLAEMLGLSYKTISRYETDRKEPKTAFWLHLENVRRQILAQKEKTALDVAV
jgi:DNA-binding transcriptional regulator YiaG